MADSLQTRPSLLVRLHDARDDAAWRQFVELYAPVIERFARQRGLQEADALDLRQNVLAAVSEGLKKHSYDPAKGSFRAWLFGVVRHQLAQLARKERTGTRGAGDTDALEQLHAVPQPDDGASALWDEQCKRQLFLWAAERVRQQVEPASWQAFWQLAVENRAPSDVATALGMRVGAVYTAKSRVLARLKREIETVDDES
jgi:RNA polymerase sigma-70 factor (ECF subfamily)